MRRNTDSPYWVAWETSLLGWARMAQGKVEAGIEMMHKGLADYRATGAELFSPYMLGLLAQAHLRTRRFDEALAFCEEALAFGERSDVHFFDAEIHRLKGKCLLSQRHNVEMAQASFERAVAVARDQGARMLELRGVIDLASLRRSEGQGGAARELLSDAIGSLAGTQMAAELEEARRLLHEWRDG